MEPQDPRFDLSDAYQEADDLLSVLSEFELSALAGAIVAEFVNRGNDTATALEKVIAAARGGAHGSKLFDKEDA